VALLGHPGPATGQGSAGFVENGRRPGSSLSGMASLIGRERGSSVVWEGEWSDVSELERSGAPFIGGRGEHRRCTRADGSPLCRPGKGKASKERVALVCDVG
jgi:hypothetical protein